MKKKHVDVVVVGAGNGGLGAPPKTMDALTYSMLLWSYCEYGIGQPSMKSHELSLAAEKALRDNGGDIWYDTEAKKLLVEDGRVAAFRLRTGKLPRTRSSAT